MRTLAPRNGLRLGAVLVCSGKSFDELPFKTTGERIHVPFGAAGENSCRYGTALNGKSERLSFTIGGQLHDS